MGAVWTAAASGQERQERQERQEKRDAALASVAGRPASQSGIALRLPPQSTWGATFDLPSCSVSVAELMPEQLSRLEKLRVGVKALLDGGPLPAGHPLARWHRFVHFWVLVWRSFVRNRCPIRASALAYATLLALIPMLAVVVSVTSSFLKQEGEERIDQFITKFVSTMTPPGTVTNIPTSTETNQSAELIGPATTDQDVIAQAPPATLQTNSIMAATNKTALADLANDQKAIAARKEISRGINQFIQNTRSGALGVTGSVLLIFAAISMLSRIESTFNDIWGVAQGRSWFMRIVLYWGVISLVPLLLVVAVGLATGPHLESTRHLVGRLPLVGGFLFHFGIQLLPVLILCLTFAAFYMLVPNTKVDWRAALVGGFVGGLLFHANNSISVLYVSRVVSNSKIYGSLGLVPVFMIGLYFSWLLLLFGAQVAYAFQNRKAYLEERQVETINQRGREFIALRLMTAIGLAYMRGSPPPSVQRLAEDLNVPSRLLMQILQTLAAARLVAEVAGERAAFLPARPIEGITCYDILLALRATQGQELVTRDEPCRAEVLGEFTRIQDAEREAAASVSMLALVHRAEARTLGR
jgi:YihY family inner membrane protein